ncbi:3' terminal RNA ribose 2'-O-methyltransferase Hen1 [Thermopolyspora flexuosa]|uniref:Small RNA 2'-O-methyltransferase n=1 Tax=Thermopolyspora flexuosa TaxID=103836 RepID=A0A543IVT7_9ACTN|nr:3' terminal RNA ribose 2'-O-methyltransferase Hen1 [Thermopolyspora flexuosa]TQM74680.1 3' terminal RNA ribose 2'-O-methyltransferase Hen1 [Thermopolyspora flexuosa]GGM78049.1 3' terminal RNA ribose 2'-O-methyltransferase Hen1 [Thermopolyspora flexuosa]
MLLTISTTLRPATDLGFLLHKHPDRVQEFGRSFGTARVFYPEATAERCTAALLLEIDPVRLARTGRNLADTSLAQYVNDRPYAASSLLAVALGDVFRTARLGRCDARPELAAAPIPLEIGIPALPCTGGPEIAHRVFAPLGWAVDARPIPLDERFPEWGDSRYLRLRLRGELRLADALNQLYVLLPVLDSAKHYWIAPDEVDKLIRAGGGWLATHPERALITRRYLGRRADLTREAFARLAELGDDVAESLEPPVEEDPAAGDEAAPAEEERGGGTPLNTLRHEAVLAALEETGARTVIDLGCGSGRLLAELLDRPHFTKVTGVDVSAHALGLAARRLRIDRMPEPRHARLQLFQAALTYTDPRFAGYDAAVLMEVIEHVDPPRLAALEKVVFGTARPGHVIVTTPNAEYNVRYPGLRERAGSGRPALRHPDHRFEWDRREFAGWTAHVASRYGYRAEIRPVGDDDPEVGPPTQMAIFTRTEGGR